MEGTCNPLLGECVQVPSRRRRPHAPKKSLVRPWASSLDNGTWTEPASRHPVPSHQPGSNVSPVTSHCPKKEDKATQSTHTQRTQLTQLTPRQRGKFVHISVPYLAFFYFTSDFDAHSILPHTLPSHPLRLNKTSKQDSVPSNPSNQAPERSLTHFPPSPHHYLRHRESRRCTPPPRYGIAPSHLARDTKAPKAPFGHNKTTSTW